MCGCVADNMAVHLYVCIVMAHGLGAVSLLYFCVHYSLHLYVCELCVNVMTMFCRAAACIYITSTVCVCLDPSGVIITVSRCASQLTCVKEEHM